MAVSNDMIFWSHNPNLDEFTNHNQPANATMVKVNILEPLLSMPTSHNVAWMMTCDSMLHETWRHLSLYVIIYWLRSGAHHIQLFGTS